MSDKFDSDTPLKDRVEWLNKLIIPPASSASRKLKDCARHDLIADLDRRLQVLEKYLHSDAQTRNNTPFWETAISPGDPNVAAILDLDQPKNLVEIANKVKASRPKIDPEWVDKVVHELGKQTSRGDQAMWITQTINDAWASSLQQLEDLNHSLKPLLTCTTSLKNIKMLSDQVAYMEAQRNIVLKSEPLLRFIASQMKELEQTKQITSSVILPSNERCATLKARIQAVNQQTLDLMERIEKLDRNLMSSVQRVSESNALFTALLMNNSCVTKQMDKSV